MKVFFEADVLFSIMYSENPTSAAKLLSSVDLLEKVTSKRCVEEAINALERLGKAYNTDLLKSIKIILNSSVNSLMHYVHDADDEHVLGACLKSNCTFLVTYNVKDFNVIEIKADLAIDVLNPGTFLNLLRYQSGFVF